MEQEFKEILAQYCPKTADELTDDLRFREDLQMSSLDFATLLGEIEDEFDLDFEDAEMTQINTIGEALEFLEAYK